MYRHLALIAAPFAATALAAMPAPAEVEVTSQGPVIALTVSESVATEPDIATVSAGVTTLARTAVDSLRQNSVQMNAVIDRLEALGIEGRDIQTSGVSLYPQYDYDQATQRQVFTGYRVSNRVSVKLRAIERTGQVLDELVSAGATDIGGIAWSVDDPAPAQAQARAAALRTARERALSMAQGAGYANIRLLEISESISSGEPMPMPVSTQAARDESVPVRPGQVETGISLSVTYEMTP